MGVENNIPEDWVKSTVGDVADVKGGKRMPKGTALIAEQTNHPYIRITDFQGNSIDKENLLYVPNNVFDKISRYIVNSGDVIISIVGTIGLIGKIDKDLDNASLTENCVKFVNLINVIPDYLFYYLSSRIGQYEVIKNTVGAVQKKLPIYGVQSIKITLPPLPEQKAITKVLTAFDDKIELLQAQNNTLETMAQTIFKEWFGKHQIGDELPEGWRVAKVNEFVKSSIGGDYGKETIEGDYTEETICLRGTDLPDMKMGTPKKAPIRFLKASKLERCKLENGDIVVEISGGTENQSTGRAMYINEKILSSANHPMTCVNFCRIIRPLKIEYSYFLHSLFDYLYTRKVFFNWENGTTGIKNLNLNALLEDFDLFIPKNEDSILDFNNNVQAVFNKIQTNNSQVQSLTKTRDTLLPKLMSGQVRVNNIKQTANA